MRVASDPRQADSQSPAPAQRSPRVESIDVVRGLVMVIMALDHTREYFHSAPPGLDPTDPAQSYALLFLTRWITYFCAPTFVLLTGISAWLRGRQSTNGSSLPHFLAGRGAWLIFLEVTIIGTAFTFHPGYLFLQVIWVIGAGLLALSLLCRLPTSIVLFIGIFIIFGHNLIGYAHDFRPGGQASLIDFIDGTFSIVTIGPFSGVLLYSALGWLGILLAGYGMGPMFAMTDEQRRTILLALGSAMIAGFIILRSVNGYGDPNPWTIQPSPERSAMAFLRVSKYPPSLDFTLVTLGPMLILLSLLERARGVAASILRTFGRVPFFYYVLHIFLIHSAAALAGMIQGLPFRSFTDPLNPPSGFGVPLFSVYLIWLTVVGSLYLPCRWFERLRTRRRDWWLSYL